MNVSFHTLGCKVNSYETEAVWELFEQAGYSRVEFLEPADVIIINTCSVTNQGEAKSRKMIRAAVKSSPGAIVVVMGCFTQLRSDDVLAIDGVSIVIGTNHRHQILEYIEEYNQIKQPISKVEVLQKAEPFENLQIRDFVRHQRAFLKIQDGCNHFCTYCIIPYARGRVRSKKPEIVLSEAKHLVSSGHQEIILTGIHTGGYGEDFNDYTFADLLRDLSLIPGLERIRISSIEINELTDEVLLILRSSSKFCSHLHIPIQSGSNRILALMNRKYTLNEFFDKIDAIRAMFPDISITTDVIVGFPGETEADFQEVKASLLRCQFSELHVFPYSDRSGTVASKMSGHLDQSTKKQRVNELLQLSTELAKSYIQKQIGLVQGCIVEGYQDGQAIGHLGNYIKVAFQSDKDIVGKLVQVQLLEEQYPCSIAKIV